MLDLTGKVAVITGAGSGIGRRIALSLAEAGADIVASDLFLDRAEATAELVREQESVHAVVKAAVHEFDRLDNGGRVIVISSLAAETATSEFSVYNATKAAVRHATHSWFLDLAPLNITVSGTRLPTVCGCWCYPARQFVRLAPASDVPLSPAISICSRTQWDVAA